MPVNGFRTGRDITVSLYTGAIAGAGVFSVRTGFTKKQLVNQERVKGADGITRFLIMPDGWEGTLDYDITDSNVDRYFALLESNYYSGINNTTGSISETVQEADTTLTQWRYTGCVWRLEDAGNGRGDSKQTYKIGWMAQRRLLVA